MAKIERLPSGLYRTRVYLGRTADGKIRVKSLTHKDKKKLASMAASYADLYRDAAGKDSFGKFAERYIKERGAILSPSSIRGYSSIAEKLKKDYSAFYALSVNDVNQSAVQAVIGSLARKKKSPKTIHNYSGFISAVLSYAKVPVPKVKLPAKVKAECYIPDTDTMRKVLRDVAGTRLEVPVNLAVLGLRRGEICGLSVSDLNGNLIHIHNTKVYTSDQKIVDKSPKTFESDRWVQLPVQLADRIRQQGYVTDYTPGALSEAWTKFLKKNGYRHFRFHDMRHFFVSFAHNILHLSDAQIMKMGGWATPSIMRTVYLQSMEDQKASDSVSTFLSTLAEK